MHNRVIMRRRIGEGDILDRIRATVAAGYADPGRPK
jgi:hypothetical protein